MSVIKQMILSVSRTNHELRKSANFQLIEISKLEFFQLISAN